MKKFYLAALIAGALVVPGAFGDRPAGRQKAQQKRIGEGVESGQLTKKETLKLEQREAKLHREIRKDRADGGGLTAKERAKIEHKQDKLSEKIYKEKHDKQTQNPK
jgi:hypothetical protein